MADKETKLDLSPSTETDDRPVSPSGEAASSLDSPDAQEIQAIIDNNMRLEKWDPRQLEQHVLNWKQHPSIQRRAFVELKEEVGYVGALLLNATTGRLLDGHMRLQDALENNEAIVPVLVIEVPEEKELIILTHLDLVGSLFKRRQSALDKLNEMAAARSRLLQSIAAGTAAEDEDEEGDSENGVIDLGPGLPEGGISLVPGEAYNYVVLIFTTDLAWTAAQDHFGLKRVKCVFNSGVGIGRVIDGDKYLDEIYLDRAGQMGGGQQKQNKAAVLEAARKRKGGAS